MSDEELCEADNKLRETPRHEIPMPEGDWSLVTDFIRKFLPAEQADKPMTPMDVVAYISQVRDAHVALAQEVNKFVQVEEEKDRVLRGLHAIVRDLSTEVRTLSKIIRGEP